MMPVHLIQFRFRRFRGFTLIEMSLGITITAMVMAAVATMTFAVSTQWQSDQVAQSINVQSTQAEARVQRIIRQAKLTGLVRTGGSILYPSNTVACVMFWLNDANDDNKIQFSEMGLLQFDKTNSKLLLYSVVWPAGWTAAQKTAADTNMSKTDLTSTTAPEDFKALQYVTSSVLTKNVTGVSLGVGSAGSTTQRPKLDVILKLKVGAVEKIEYFSAVLRGPINTPS